MAESPRTWGLRRLWKGFVSTATVPVSSVNEVDVDHRDPNALKLVLPTMLSCGLSLSQLQAHSPFLANTRTSNIRNHRRHYLAEHWPSFAYRWSSRAAYCGGICRSDQHYRHGIAK
jgi:hypothetical protein